MLSSPRRRLALLAAIVWPILLAACAGQHVRPQVRPPAPAPTTAVVRTAASLLGVPYRLGGADPRGFDCSGFVYYVFAQNGVRLPRGVKQQWTAGREVTRGALRPGDLLFFSTTAPGPTHVALVVDRDRFVHAPNSQGVVRVESLSATYWSRRFLGARRVGY